MNAGPPLPADFRVALDPGVRWVGDEPLLVGGSPIRLLRLTPPGRELIDQLVAGEPVPRSEAAQRLVRRLLDGGLAHPRPAASPASSMVTAVIPVRDDPAGLRATLEALASSALSAVVVDDLSADATLIAGACSGHRVSLLRRAAWGGPAAARNDGWRATDSPFVAFIDANCEPEPGWHDTLLPHFADPRVAAVAPRIVAAAGPDLPTSLAAYESVASPLDLGDREAIVRPRSPVAYVPTAALVVRRTALEAVNGFDESLTVGEDVDFVWRLVAAGWTVRYEPRATVRHPVRPRWSAWLAQRYRYGTSAAALARRHGTAVAPLVVSPWTAAAWGLMAAGRPALGAVPAGYSVAALAGRAPRRDPVSRGERGVRLPVKEAIRLAGTGHLRGGLAIARALRRAWPPAAVALAVASRRSRPALAATVVVPGLLEWLDRRPRLDPARFAALRLADDLAYAAGVWAGCARERSGRALVPDLAVRRSIA